MSYIPGDIYYKQLVTFNISGVSTNMDAVPTAVLVKNGIDDYSTNAKVFVSNVDIGRYNISGVIPNTYSRGVNLNIAITGYMGGSLTKAIVDIGVLEGFRLGDPGITVSVTGLVSSNPVSVSGGTINNILNSVNVSAPAPANFLIPTSVAPGVTVSVTGSFNTTISSPVSVSGGTINHLVDPVSITGTNTFSSTDLSQIRYKIGIDGTSSAPVNQYAGHLELSSSGVSNIFVENGINMNRYMSLIGAVIVGSSIVNGNNITYYAVNNNSTQRVNATAISGSRQNIILT